MGFLAVTLNAADWELAWQAEWHHKHELNLDGLVTLEFGGAASVMWNRVFRYLSELAAESWFKAAARWRTTFEKPFRPVAPGLHLSPA